MNPVVTPRTFVAAIAIVLATPLAGAQELIYQWDGTQASEWLGYDVRGAGDVNGDGVPDAIVGSITDHAVVYSGADGAVLFDFPGPGTSVFGYEASGAGDVDGDGRADLLVGSPSYGANRTGAVWVYSGNTGTLLYSVAGQPGDFFGWSVSEVGDLDGDGRGDFVGGAPVPGPGYASVHSGSGGGLLWRLAAPPGRDADSFGLAVRGAGDVDLDGIPDVIVGDPYAGNQGYQSGSAWVFSGATGGVLWELHGPTAQAQFGAAVDGVGDLDGDGHGDFVVGAPWYNAPSCYDGIFYVYSGKDATKLFWHTRPCSNESLGSSVSGADDLNGDGVPEVLVGAPTGPYGTAWIYSGLDGMVLDAIHSAVYAGGLGHGVSHLGDVDRDGRPDLLTSGIGYSVNAPGGGAAFAYAGDDLYLWLYPPQAYYYDYVTVTTRNGTPGYPAALYVTAIDGSPVLLRLAMGVFDGWNRFVVAGYPPSGFSGTTITLQSFALTPGGKLIDATPETLTLK